MPWPSERAWQRLIATEEDAHEGTTYYDLDLLLNEWEITNSYPGDGLRTRQRFHARAPEFVFGYPLSTKLEPPTVVRICEQIRALHRRLTNG